MSADEKSLKTKYLVIGGILSPDFRVELRPGFLTDNHQFAEEATGSRLTAELHDERGEVLVSFGVAASRVCGDGGKVANDLMFTGKIPFPSGARALRLKWDGRVVHEEQISACGPEVTVDWKPTSDLSGATVINWTASHPEEKPLHYFLRYTNDGGKSWQPVSMVTAETKEQIDFDQLPGGEECRVAVVATDGVNTTMKESEPFALPLKTCRTFIFSPEGGETFDTGSQVLLRGQGFYLEENHPETKQLVWTSSQDGELGTGMTVRVEGLSPGPHRISLTAGTGERAGEANVSILIGKQKMS